MVQSNPILKISGFVTPIIEQEFQRIEHRLFQLSDVFDEKSICRELAKTLNREVSHIVGKVAVVELHMWRIQGKLEGDTPESRFEFFCKQIQTPEIAKDILNRYPILQKMITRFVTNWTDAILTFLDRLIVDWKELEAQFNLPLGKVSLLTIGLGDYHNGGQSVCKITFSDGYQLIYKPRCGLIDLQFHRFLEWLHDHGCMLDFKVPIVLDQTTHSWIEYIHAAGCEHEEQIHRFYERLGAYLAILYILEATDFHYENIIASGEYPVFIDLESLFHPRVPKKQVNDSVLRTGLVPYRLWGNSNQQGVDISGLGGDPAQAIPIQVPTWIDRGKDTMRAVYHEQKLSGGQNRPMLQGEYVQVESYIPNLLQGFQQVYELFLANKEELLGEDSPLQWFEQVEVRAIVRDTSVYDYFLQESSHPPHLIDLHSYDEFLTNLNLILSNIPKMSAVIPIERTSLIQWDIPYFTSIPSSTSIFYQGKPIENFFDQPSIHYVKRKIASLSREDLEKQSWIIRSSILLTSKQPYRVDTAENQTPTFRPDLLLEEAGRIGGRLIELSGNPDAPTWLGIQTNGLGWGLSPVGLDLYNGLSGIALFFGALSHVTKEEKYKQFARNILTQIQFGLQYERINNLGAYNGLSGVIYTLSNLSLLWDDSSLQEWSEQLIEQLPSYIQEDQDLDWIGGVAGCIAVMLQVYEKFGSTRALEIAIECGELLCEKAVHTPDGVGWITKEANLLTGMSHGTAGYAYALFQLSSVTGIDTFQEVARKAIQFERNKFHVKRGNWSNRSNEDKVSYDIKWCSGAPGIGLARLLSSQYEADPNFQDEINVAIQTTEKEGFGANHSLCHGDLGNLELLLMAHQHSYSTNYTNIMRQVFHHITTQGRLCGNPFFLETPSLMAGISGIGYGLLRLYNPNQVPSVLGLKLFERKK